MSDTVRSYCGAAVLSDIAWISVEDGTSLVQMTEEQGGDWKLGSNDFTRNTGFNGALLHLFSFITCCVMLSATEAFSSFYVNILLQCVDWTVMLCMIALMILIMTTAMGNACDSVSACLKSSLCSRVQKIWSVSRIEISGQDSTFKSTYFLLHSDPHSSCIRSAWQTYNFFMGASIMP